MKRFVAVGGGEMRAQESINRYIVNLIDRTKLENRTKPYAVFLPQASHESKPYTNSFFKTYGKLKCKADVILFASNEMDKERIAYKLNKADIIYIGGGDARYMLDEFDKMGIGEMLVEAYNKGTVIAGNSAGAMCLFEHALSDYIIERGLGQDYVLIDGYGAIGGTVICHADEEKRIDAMSRLGIQDAVRVDTNSAIYFEDGIAKDNIEIAGDDYVGL